MFMGYTFTGCSGSYKKGSIESLSFKVAKLPKEFIIQQVFIFDNIHYSSILYLESFIQKIHMKA